MTATATITSILRNFDGNPNIVSIVTTADLTTITTAGYLTNEDANIQKLENGVFQWAVTDLVLIYYSGGIGFFTHDSINATFISLTANGGLSSTLSSGDIFVGNGSNIATGVAMSGDTSITNAGVVTIANGAITNAKVNAAAAIDFSKLAALPSTNILVGNGSNVATAVAMSGNGTLSNAGVLTVSGMNASITSAAGQTFTNSTSSTTPGTIRALKGLEVGTGTTMTSGNLVGVRGEVDYVGASGGFLYGVQGKLIPTGTLSGSSWNAGVFGQFDISAATVNAGQMAPIWGDYGASSGTLTDQTGLYGIAMTNTTAAVLAGQLYLYGGATNLMLLSTNAGLSGVTYFKNSGVSAGSWGNATPPTPSKVLQISVDGTLYYLPLVAQNT